MSWLENSRFRTGDHMMRVGDVGGSTGRADEESKSSSVAEGAEEGEELVVEDETYKISVDMSSAQ